MKRVLQTFAMAVLLVGPAMASDVVVKPDPVVPGQMVIRENGQAVAFVRPDPVVPGQYRVMPIDGTRTTYFTYDRLRPIRKGK